MLACAVIGAVLAHRRLPWIPVPYLAALILLPIAGWRAARWRAAPRVARWATAAVATAAFVALCPVPWMKADLDHPPGSAWALDGRLVINGDPVDPPGTWYWLTVGRPPILAEVVRSWLSTDAPEPTDLRNGRVGQRPAVTEPAAATVGLRRAGWTIATTTMIEVSEPLDAAFPTQAVLALVNGLDLSTRERWDAAVRGLGDRNTFTTNDGISYEFAGRTLPFGKVNVIERPEQGLDAAIGGALAGTLPGSWYRNLSLGASHGLMVALVSYVYGSGDDLAMGRAIAGTGTIRADATVGRIVGLREKAGAARDVGADVMLFPAAQAADLDGFDPGSMQLVPVTSLDDAIAALTAPPTRSP